MPRKRYVCDNVFMGKEDSASVVDDHLKELKEQGWKDLNFSPYIPDNGRGVFDNSRPARITGLRPMTAKEIAAEKRAKEAAKRRKERAKKRKADKEIKELKRLAKKHGYELKKV